MKKILTTSIAAILCLVFCSSTKAEGYFISPSATFSKMWVDYDVWENGIKGMRLHFKFKVYSMKGVDGDVAVFFKDEYGNRLRDKNKSFYSSGGDVAVYIDIKPGYDPADYNDLTVFMPYSELDIEGAGKYNLSMDAKLISSDGTTIQDFTTYPFEYTKGSNVTTPSAISPEAIFDKMWVDYDVTENGKRGMKIHLKCQVNNLKDSDCYVAIYFENDKGDRLTTKNILFSNEDGEIVLYVHLTPGYDKTSYNDLTVFMPYDELNLSVGKYDLSMDVDVEYRNGDLLNHLNYYNFWYEKKS